MDNCLREDEKIKQLGALAVGNARARMNSSTPSLASEKAVFLPSALGRLFQLGARERSLSANRIAISKRVRFEVFKRDNFTCQYCGAHPPGTLLHVDHVQAVANGGTNDIDNLVTSCEPCNLGKGARSLSAIPKTLAEKALIAAEKEEQLLGYQEILEAKRARLEAEVRKVAAELLPEYRQEEVNANQATSIKNFIDRLGLHEVLEASEISYSKFPRSEGRRWSYFCGVCWRKVRREQGEVIAP